MNTERKWMAALLLAGSGVCTFSLTSLAAEDTKVEPPVAVTAPAGAAAEVKSSIDYVETDIQAALRQLAARAGVNLIMGDEVTGKVTVHLEGVEFEDAMQLIAESKGYAFLKDKSVVKVKSRASLDVEPLEVRVRTLNYAKAEDIKKSLEPALTSRGKMQVDVRSNTLIMSDTPTNLGNLAPLLDALDTQTPQVMIEAKFVETSKDPKKDLGFNWTDTLLNHSLSAGANQTDPVTGENVSGFSLIKNLAGGGWTPATAVLNAGQAQVVFSYMSGDNDTELLASPRIVTTDNGKAKISIAKQFPIPNFQFSEQTAALQISGFTYKDIGIILNVTPRINKDSFITLEVSPEASSQAGSTRLGSKDATSAEIPIISTRTANTTVLIKSGHTLAIGGLMQRDVDDKYTKVPLLGDIPGVGVMFRSKSLHTTKRDLLIFLTPTIIAPDAKTGYEKYYDGLPADEVYTNDKWMPKDNAKPREFTAKPATPDKAAGPAQQNFGAKH